MLGVSIRAFSAPLTVNSQGNENGFVSALIFSSSLFTRFGRDLYQNKGGFAVQIQTEIVSSKSETGVHMKICVTFAIARRNRLCSDANPFQDD